MDDRDPYPYGTWVNGIRVGWWNGRCKRCFIQRTAGGHDPCISNLPGVKAACCGHGETLAYCAWEDGVVKHWEEVAGKFQEVEFQEVKCEIHN